VARSVIACHDLTSLRSEPERDEVTRLAATLRDLRGFLVVDCTGEDAAPADLEAAVRTLRACLAQAALAACTW
jgi:hypothetical protein